MAPPRATARLQFHAGFTFADAERQVPYLARLGISHLYASPLFAARIGSMHGYDVIDYATINPELGGREGLDRLVQALRRHGMGLVLDIVPNHMAADSIQNPWWRDVLAKGQGSPYARFFDIDWAPSQPWLRGKVLLPVLGRPYADVVKAGELKIDSKSREIAYFDQRFPLSDSSDVNEPLDAVLDAQHYRLAWWRTAGDTINWRRFFDVNGLAALRAERPEVFDATHRLVIELFADGLIDGVRVDHIDGLADPAGYCRRLRETLTEAGGRRPYIVVEKILAVGEALPTDWEVDGTTGYDFMAEAGGLLHDPAGEAPLSQLWAGATGRDVDFSTMETSLRAELVHRLFGAELARLVKGRDDPAALARGMAAIASQFRVYRLYPDGVTGPLDQAVAAARDMLPRAEWVWLERAHCMLKAGADQGRFQLLTAPLAAKSVEDTAFYRYGRLLSNNEVGSSPDHFSRSPEAFHQAVLDRQRAFPHAMLATATHDHKRGEDVRARIAVLSEIPSEWATVAEAWMRRNKSRRRTLTDGPAPEAGDELMLYQTLVGAWPALLDPADDDGAHDLATRVAQWQDKALREAKHRSDWAEPNQDYEDACRGFLQGMLADRESRRDLAAFAARIGPAGAVNGLTQTMLRLTVPGVPDLYQGTEFWDESLVDPDNRRPVDFGARHRALSPEVPLLELLRDWRDGRVKQALIARMLSLRAECPELFSQGTYRPVAISGAQADHLLGFLREEGRHCLLVAVTRLPVPLLGDGQRPWIDPSAWRDTVLHVPARTWRNMLMPAATVMGGGTLGVGELLGGLTIGCWMSDRE